MDFIVSALGLPLPALKARDCLRRQRSCRVAKVEEQKIVWGCDHEQDLWNVPEKAKCDDDETASTLSESDSSLSSSSESLSSCVTFATPLVTAVHTRPFTSKEEKAHLYYNENDYRHFRMDFRRSLYRKQPAVSFSPKVVSQIHVLPFVENKHDVYYSSGELKQFLEDFILSLDDKQNA